MKVNTSILSSNKKLWSPSSIIIKLIQRYHSKNARELLTEVRGVLNVFEALNSDTTPLDVKNKISGIIKNNQLKYIVFERRHKFTPLLIASLIAAILLLVIVVSYQANIFIFPKSNSNAIFNLVLLAVLLSASWVVIAVFPSMILSKLHGLNQIKFIRKVTFLWSGTVFYATLSSSAIVITFLGFLRPFESLSEDESVIVFTAMLSFTLTFLSVILTRTFNSYLDWRNRRFIPQQNIVFELIVVLYLLQQQEWSNSDNKLSILRRLEKIARSFEYLPRHLKSGDIITDEIFETSMTRVATSIRAKKMWLLTPSSNTNYQLRLSLSATLERFVTGNWDELEKQEPPKITKVHVGFAIKRFVKNVIQATLPLAIACIVYVTHFPITLSNELANYIFIGTFIWIIISLLHLVDPDYDNKLDNLKKIRDIFLGK